MISSSNVLTKKRMNDRKLDKNSANTIHFGLYWSEGVSDSFFEVTLANRMI